MNPHNSMPKTTDEKPNLPSARPAGSVIWVLFSPGGAAVGWTADERWAIGWEYQLRGRWTKRVEEIIPDSNVPAQRPPANDV